MLLTQAVIFPVLLFSSTFVLTGFRCHFVFVLNLFPSIYFPYKIASLSFLNMHSYIQVFKYGGPFSSADFQGAMLFAKS